MSSINHDEIWAHDESAKRGLVEAFLNGELPPWDLKKNKELERLLATYPYEYGPESISKAIIQTMEAMKPGTSLGVSIDTFKDFESFLVASGFRGHFIHQFEVYLLGLNILMAAWKLAGSAEERAKIFGSKSANVLADSWLLTAMGHDLGYPVQSARWIAKKLSDLYEKMGYRELANEFKLGKESRFAKWEPMLQQVSLDSNSADYTRRFFMLEELVVTSISDTFGTKDTSSAQDFVKKMIEDDNHGVVSALILARTIVYNQWNQLKLSSAPEMSSLGKFFNTTKGKLAKMAIAGVALHDCPSTSDVFEKFTFYDNPIAVTLYIADNLQDWERTYNPNARCLWNYRLVSFQNKGSHIILNCHLQPNRKVDNPEEGFRKEIENKRAIQKKLKVSPDKVGVRLTAQFSLQGSDNTAEIVEFEF